MKFNEENLKDMCWRFKLTTLHVIMQATAMAVAWRSEYNMFNTMVFILMLFALFAAIEWKLEASK